MVNSRPFDENFPVDGNLLLDKLNVMVLVFNTEGLVYINAAVEDVLGYTPQELMQKSLLDLVHPNFRLDVGNRIKKRIEGDQTPAKYFTQLVTSDGDYRWVEINVSGIEADGEAYIMGTAIDITEQMEAELAAHEQRMLSRALQQTAAALTSSTELEDIFQLILSNLGRIIPHETVSIFLIEYEAVARIVSSQGFVERNLQDWAQRLRINVDVFPIFQQAVETQKGVLVSDTTKEERWQFLGETAWIKSHICTPIRLDGQVIGFLNIDSNRPEQFNEKHVRWMESFADQAATAINNSRLFSRLEEERAQLKAILDASGESICYIEGSNIAYANRSFAALTGFELDVILDTPITAFWMENEFQDEIFFEMQETVLDGGIWRDVLELRRRDGGSVKTAFTVSAIGGSTSQSVRMVAVIRDISQEERLRERQTRFIANVAHEMRTPLTSLTTRLYLMKRKPDDRDKHLVVIEDVSQRMVELVEDMKLFFEFEREEIQLQPVSQPLQPILEKSLAELEPRIAKRDLTVNIDLPPEPIRMIADATYAGRVLHTLLEYMVLNSGSAAEITVSFHRQDHEAIVRFQGSNHGVAAPDLQFIFDPFHYASVGGEVLTGLELPIAKHIMDMHNWHVRIDSSSEPILRLDLVMSADVIEAHDPTTA